jgi:hypothetical protein
MQSIIIGLAIIGVIAVCLFLVLLVVLILDENRADESIIDIGIQYTRRNNILKIVFVLLVCIGICYILYHSNNSSSVTITYDKEIYDTIRFKNGIIF